MNYQPPILDLKLPAITIQQEKPETPQPVIYTVKDGDTLTSIATTENTTIQRLFDKNTDLSNPDQMKPGDKLVVPQNDETLTDRPFPQPIQATIASISSSSVNVHPGVPGNSYDSGQCTWYVKNRRPDVPNNWGNASDWLYNAHAQGWATGSVPRAGAVGWTSGHVVYVESVEGGNVTISEMNYDFVPYHQRTIVKPASTYVYIY